MSTRHPLYPRVCRSGEPRRADYSFRATRPARRAARARIARERCGTAALRGRPRPWPRRPPSRRAAPPSTRRAWPPRSRRSTASWPRSSCRDEAALNAALHFPHVRLASARCAGGAGQLPDRRLPRPRRRRLAREPLGRAPPDPRRARQGALRRAVQPVARRRIAHRPLSLALDRHRARRAVARAGALELRELAQRGPGDHARLAGPRRSAWGLRARAVHPAQGGVAARGLGGLLGRGLLAEGDEPRLGALRRFRLPGQPGPSSRGQSVARSRGFSSPCARSRGGIAAL